MALLLLVSWMLFVTSVNSCPAGWEEYRDHCYYFSDFELTWTDANQICKEIDPTSSLATISNLYEVAFVNEKLGGAKHIGLNDIEQEGVYVWASGEPVTLENWSCHQPDNSDNVEDCVEMREDGRFNDRDCNFYNNFVCKK